MSQGHCLVPLLLTTASRMIRSAWLCLLKLVHLLNPRKGNGMKKEVTAEDCESAGRQVVQYQDALQQFSNILASCYATSEEDCGEVKKIRTQIGRNTNLYRELHFRASIEFITGLREVMRSYKECTPDEFVECIEEVAEEAAQYKSQAELVQDLHVDLLSDCKTLTEDAEAAAKQLELQAKENQALAKSQITKSVHHQNNAEAGVLVGGLMTVGSLIAATVPTGGLSIVLLFSAAFAGGYSYKHESMKIQAISSSIAATARANNALLAAQRIAGPMSSCVETLTQVISQATLFFTTVNDQLQTFKHSADIASEKKLREIQGKIKLHCVKLQAPASKLVHLCDGFLQKADIVDAELKRICSTEENHKSFIQDWLEKKEQSLKLVEVLEHRKGDRNTRWDLIKRWCPSVHGMKPQRPSPSLGVRDHGQSERGILLPAGNRAVGELEWATEHFTDLEVT